MRLVITFFLSLCFLFSRGYENLYAAASQNITSRASTNLSKTANRCGLVSVNDIKTSISKSATSPAEDNLINATETEDDDEFTFSKKFVQITNYFISSFNAQISAYYQHSQNRLPFCKHFSYTSSTRYIVQRVIKI